MIKWTAIIKITTHGLKCDNHGCEFRNSALAASKQNIGMKCPECGASLFTQADYNSLRLFRIAARTINVLLFPLGFFNSNRAVLTAKMDGSGKIKI